MSSSIMEYSTWQAVNPCMSSVQVGQPTLMDGFQTQTNSQITTIIRVHLVATAVCHGIADLFETLILLVNIQTFFGESLELVQSSTKFLFNLRNRRMLQLQHTGKDLPGEGCRVSPSPAVQGLTFPVCRCRGTIQMFPPCWKGVSAAAPLRLPKPGSPGVGVGVGEGFRPLRPCSPS